MMTTFEIISLMLGSGGLITVLGIAFSLGKIFQKIENVAQQTKKIENIDQRLAKLEGRFEERG